MTLRRGIALSVLACLMAAGAVAKADDGLTEYPLPADQGIGQAAGPRAIVSGPGGALWFIENQGKLGRIAPDGKLLAPRRILEDDGAIHQLIALGDGSLWVLANGVPGHDQATLGRVEPSGATQWFTPQTDTGLSSMEAIAPASDGRSLWAIGDDGLHGQVYLVDGSGAFRLVKAIASAGEPGSSVAVGGDGAAWWGDISQGLTRMTPDGAQDRYGLPSNAYSVALGPGPGVWYVTKAADSLANSASPGGALTSYAIPEVPPPLLQRGYISPLDLVYQARDDALWIAAAGSVVRLTGQGNAQVYFLPPNTLETLRRIAPQITGGPDGALWFTEPHPQSAGIPDPDPGAIARLDPSAVPAFCTHSPSVSVPLREAVIPSPELKSMAAALSFAIQLEQDLDLIVGVSLFATPIGVEEIFVTSAINQGLGVSQVVLTRIAQDPPDPNFRDVFTPAAIRPRRIHAGSGVTRAVAAAVNRLLASEARIGALEAAYLHAVERSQGAEAAQDNAWVTRQDLAAADYAGRLAKAYARDAQLRRRVATAVSHSPLRKVHITKRQIKAAKRKLAQGVPPGARRMLHRAGYTATEIAALARRARQAKVSPTTLGAVIAGLPVQQLAPQAVTAFEHVAARATCVANG